jgi:hypothetical protein
LNKKREINQRGSHGKGCEDEKERNTQKKYIPTSSILITKKIYMLFANAMICQKLSQRLDESECFFQENRRKI